MSSDDQHIFLISFEKDTLASVLNCLVEAFSNLDSQRMPADFALDKVISNDLTDGLVVSVKRKLGGNSKLLRYYPLNSREIASKTEIIAALEQSPKALQQGCLVYCFAAENLKNGFGAFDNVEGTDYVKFEQTRYLLSQPDIRAFNLIVFSPGKGGVLEELFEYGFIPNNMYLDGRKLSVLLNGENRYLEQYEHFLELPTFVILNNEFIPKIPF